MTLFLASRVIASNLLIELINKKFMDPVVHPIIRCSRIGVVILVICVGLAYILSYSPVSDNRPSTKDVGKYDFDEDDEELIAFPETHHVDDDRPPVRVPMIPPNERESPKVVTLTPTVVDVPSPIHPLPIPAASHTEIPLATDADALGPSPAHPLLVAVAPVGAVPPHRDWWAYPIVTLPAIFNFPQIIPLDATPSRYTPRAFPTVPPTPPGVFPQFVAGDGWLPVYDVRDGSDAAGLAFSSEDSAFLTTLGFVLLPATPQPNVVRHPAERLGAPLAPTDSLRLTAEPEAGGLRHQAPMLPPFVGPWALRDLTDSPPLPSPPPVWMQPRSPTLLVAYVATGRTQKCTIDVLQTTANTARPAGVMWHGPTAVHTPPRGFPRATPTYYLDFKLFHALSVPPDGLARVLRALPALTDPKLHSLFAGFEIIDPREAYWHALSLQREAAFAMLRADGVSYTYWRRHSNKLRATWTSAVQHLRWWNNWATYYSMYRGMALRRMWEARYGRRFDLVVRCRPDYAIMDFSAVYHPIAWNPTPPGGSATLSQAFFVLFENGGSPYTDDRPMELFYPRFNWDNIFVATPHSMDRVVAALAFDWLRIVSTYSATHNGTDQQSCPNNRHCFFPERMMFDVCRLLSENGPMHMKANAAWWPDTCMQAATAIVVNPRKDANKCPNSTNGF